MSEGGVSNEAVSATIPVNESGETMVNQATLPKVSRLAQVKARTALVTAKTQEGLRAARAVIARAAGSMRRSQAPEKVVNIPVTKVDKSLGRKIIESPVTRSVVVGGKAIGTILQFGDDAAQLYAAAVPPPGQVQPEQQDINFRPEHYRVVPIVPGSPKVSAEPPKNQIQLVGDEKALPSRDELEKDIQVNKKRVLPPKKLAPQFNAPKPAQIRQPQKMPVKA